MPNKIPEGFHTLTPSLNIEGAEKAIALYQKALGATVEGEVMKCPETGKVMHAILNIGNSKIMLADVFEGCPTGPTHSVFYCYVKDADAAYRQAVEAGLTSGMEPQDMFWGDRLGSVTDPYGNSWSFATHVRDVSKDELNRGAKEWSKQQKAGKSEAA